MAYWKIFSQLRLGNDYEKNKYYKKHNKYDEIRVFFEKVTNITYSVLNIQPLYNFPYLLSNNLMTIFVFLMMVLFR